MKQIIILLFMMTTGIPVRSQVEIIAHRGASWLAPENTVASANLAWEKGADAVEVDIYLSKDKKILCNHDATTKRTSGQDFRIADTESRILRKLDVGSLKDKKYKGEKIPFLKEVIRTVPPGKELIVEIKCKSEILPYLQKIIENNSKNRKYTFICFDLQTIADTKKTFPGNPCYWLCSNAELLEENFDKVAEAKLNGISLTFSIITDKVMEKAKNAGFDVYAWTVDDPAEAKRLVALGVKGITTNRPGWLEEQAGL